ncbi:MAG TPA: aldehyde dehydrogenase (NADP(+)) [Capsulimonadaceae bacterium]|nr:aldehyde dehydrogenase (NADP(+)) [Capsulimonadaceae bacterium]
MKLHGKNIIGRELSAEGPEMRDQSGLAGATDDQPRFHAATEAEVDRAVNLAEASFFAYRSLPSERRANFLDRIAARILDLGDQFLEITHQETGLPIARLTGERGRTVGQLRMFADLIREGSWVEARIDRAQPEREPAPRPDLRRMLIPLGPVGVFGASNFPYAFSVAGGDTASAFAAGCPVIVKAHSAHPRTSEMTARAILAAAEETDMPEGSFSMIYGRDAGISLVRHPFLTAVGFTGSREAGMRLFHEAANRPRPIPIFAEMSAVNPVFVLPGALRERGETIAAGLAQSATLGMGQFCTKPGLVFTQGDAKEPFARAVSDKISQVAPARMLHEGILQAYAKGIDRLLDTPGARLAGCAAEAANSEGQAGAAVFATDAATFARTPSLAEEVFGPATLLIAAETPQELEEAARNLEGQLTATVHATTEDLRENRVLISILETKVGRLLYNGFPTGVEVVSSMQHGGPFPSTTDSRATSVGTAAIIRFVRPLCYQNAPQETLPLELQDSNPRNIWRLVDNEWTRAGL